MTIKLRKQNMEHRNVKEEYKQIAGRLIDTVPELAYIKDSNVKIAYLESDQAKKVDKDKLVLGECEKVAAKNKWAIDYDFTITLFEPNLYGLSAKQIEIVLFHELLHVGIDYGENGEVYSVRKHDLEDFKIIIDKYGTNWAKVEN